MAATVTDSTAGFELRPSTETDYILALRGNLEAGSTAGLWERLRTELGHLRVSKLEVDGTGIEYCDSAGLALLQFLSMGGMLPSGSVTTVCGLRPELLRLLRGFTAADFRKNGPQAPVRRPLAHNVGSAAVAVWADIQGQISFIGETSVALCRNLAHRKAMRWREVWRVFEQAGVNALPIISLISLLVGLIIAFEAAAPFARFGARILIANMLGITMVRELSALMTAIILAGRSGSAFAAELGTMKVNEELNALETMGLNPTRFLVVQRILAGTLLTPLLTIYSMFVSVLGGVLVMLTMGFTLRTIFYQMAQSLHCTDIAVGIVKGVIFGALIAGAGCLRGLQTGQGPSAVGVSTTRAVVSGILLVIVGDALLAVLLYFLGL